MKVNQYVKFVVAGVTAAAVTAQAAISDGTITSDEAWKIGLAAAGAILVLLAPNAITPSQRAQVVAEQAEARRGTTYQPPLRPKRPGPYDQDQVE